MEALSRPGTDAPGLQTFISNQVMAARATGGPLAERNLVWSFLQEGQPAVGETVRFSDTARVMFSLTPAETGRHVGHCLHTRGDRSWSRRLFQLSQQVSR